MSHHDNGAFLAPPTCQAVILLLEILVFGARRTVSRFDQRTQSVCPLAV
jgi:hypothetical protein